MRYELKGVIVYEKVKDKYLDIVTPRAVEDFIENGGRTRVFVEQRFRPRSTFGVEVFSKVVGPGGKEEDFLLPQGCRLNSQCKPFLRSYRE